MTLTFGITISSSTRLVNYIYQISYIRLAVAFLFSSNKKVSVVFEEGNPTSLVRTKYIID